MKKKAPVISLSGYEDRDAFHFYSSGLNEMRTVIIVILLAIIVVLAIGIYMCWHFISLNNQMGNDEALPDEELESYPHPENVHLMKDDLYVNFDTSVKYTHTPQEFKLWTRGGSKSVRIQDPVSKRYLAAGPYSIYPSSKGSSIWDFAGDYIVSGPYFLDVVPLS